MRYLAAALLALPVGGLVWFELVYLVFGFTAEDTSPAVNVTAAAAAFGLSVGWPLRGAHRPAAVVERSCRLGVLAAILLPIVSVAVLLIWVNAADRPDLGMGGLMLYSLPVVACVAAFVLVLAFGLCRAYAARRLHPMLDTQGIGEGPAA